MKVEMNYTNGLSPQAIKKMFHKQSFELIIDRMTDARISAISRRGKHLGGVIINDKYENELYISVHLGMAGAWLHGETEEDIIPKYRKHIHVKATLDDGTILAYSDIRRQGGFSVYTAEEYGNILSIRNLGPEPFWEDSMPMVLANVRHKRWSTIPRKGDMTKKSIKAALMDQSVMAGTGNIYACEALREAGINPKELVKDLTDEEIIRTFSHSRDLMAFSIKVGGTTFRDYVNGNGMMGGFQDHLKVYGKKNCGACGTTIIAEEIAGRTTHWCPTCQPLKNKTN